jgi:hypothetical protein
MELEDAGEERKRTGLRLATVGWAAASGRYISPKTQLELSPSASAFKLSITSSSMQVPHARARVYTEPHSADAFGRDQIKSLII